MGKGVVCVESHELLDAMRDLAACILPPTEGEAEGTLSVALLMRLAMYLALDRKRRAASESP